jgi:hypothetical protein
MLYMMIIYLLKLNSSILHVQASTPYPAALKALLYDAARIKNLFWRKTILALAALGAFMFLVQSSIVCSCEYI